MLRFLLFIAFCLPFHAMAWNAAGHRLSALIAWQQLTPASQQEIAELLAGHPDYAGWREKADAVETAFIFAEAATWADSIRHDPHYYDADRETPTSPRPGLSDQDRHRDWHYVDFDERGRRMAGEIDRATARLTRILSSASDQDERRWALVWLLHLVGDLHQPLHVGRFGDEGGNLYPVEDPGRRNRAILNLHRYWDELPGPSNLRGGKLEKRAAELLARHSPPPQKSITAWRNESHALLAEAYPSARDGLLPVITDEFSARAGQIAEQRIVAAGYRLGRLLEALFGHAHGRKIRDEQGFSIEDAHPPCPTLSSSRHSRHHHPDDCEHALIAPVSRGTPGEVR